MGRLISEAFNRFNVPWKVDYVKPNGRSLPVEQNLVNAVASYTVVRFYQSGIALRQPPRG